MSLSSILPGCLWLIISAACYAALWLTLIRRFENLGILILNLGLSAILSPGVLTGGHGAIPFPGGVAFLLTGLGKGMGPISIFNIGMWMLTFSIFSVCGWLLKRALKPSLT